MTRAVIFANGLLTEPMAVRRHIAPDDFIICANGGTRHAASLGLQPDLIVGDLDSLPADLLAELRGRGVRVQAHPARKDQTDLELALQAAAAAGVDEAVIVTALGGRLDQMLANILLLTRPEWSALALSLVDGRQRATLLRGPGGLTVPGAPGDTLSLIPLTERASGIALTGVEWPLDGASISLGSTLTISNALTRPAATVRIERGLVLVVHIPLTDSNGGG
ncbi:MAG: thiamine diphosphokinase [Anaerolineae bacterium]